MTQHFIYNEATKSKYLYSTKRKNVKKVFFVNKRIKSIEKF